MTMTRQQQLRANLETVEHAINTWKFGDVVSIDRLLKQRQFLISLIIDEQLATFNHG